MLIRDIILHYTRKWIIHLIAKRREGRCHFNSDQIYVKWSITTIGRLRCVSRPFHPFVNFVPRVFIVTPLPWSSPHHRLFSVKYYSIARIEAQLGLSAKRGYEEKYPSKIGRTLASQKASQVSDWRWWRESKTKKTKKKERSKKSVRLAFVRVQRDFSHFSKLDFDSIRRFAFRSQFSSVVECVLTSTLRRFTFFFYSSLVRSTQRQLRWTVVDFGLSSWSCR